MQSFLQSQDGSMEEPMKQLKVMMGLGVCILTTFAMATDSPSFRGPDRNGKYAEKGLMKTWPDQGPKELWDFNGLGEGYSSMAIVDDTIYTTGKTDEEGFLFAISTAGKLKWKVSYGYETDGRGYPGSRSTPEVDGDMLYITNGSGKVMAFKRADGGHVWTVDMSKFGGRYPRFNISESVLIDGDKVICTPGGEGAGVVALNKKTGETIWKTTGLNDKASYCSARIFDNGKVRQIITLLDQSMVGINPENGKLIWRVDYPIKYGIHAVSPVFHGNTIYVADGYKQGGRAFKLADDGKSVSDLWAEKSIDIHHGGAISLNGYVYGASSSGTWGCIDLETGKVVARFRDIGKGSAIYADGRLYGYDEKGRVGLIDPDPKNFKVVSWFQIEKGSGQHWNHPVIHKGKLYIRHGNAMMCYDISTPDA